MLEEYENFLNLDQVIKDKYNYDVSVPKEDFYEQDFVELEGNGISALCWLNIDGEEYLFKPVEDFDFNVWGELLSESVAKSLDIPCAKYRACSLLGQKGVLTKNVLKKDESLVLGCELFQDYFNQFPNKKKNYISALNNTDFVDLYQIPAEFLRFNHYDQQRYLFSYLNNLEQVWGILSSLDQVNNDKVSEIIKSLSKMLIFDIITLQGDRHVNNWGVIKDEFNDFQISPLFDNTVSFGLGFPNMQDKVNDFKNEMMNFKRPDDDKINKMIYEAKPSFTLSNDNNIDPLHKKKDNSLKVYEDFLNKSDSENMNLAINMVNKIDSDRIEESIVSLEKSNGITMNDEIKNYIYNVMDFHCNNLREINEKYKRSEVVNDVRKEDRNQRRI